MMLLLSQKVEAFTCTTIPPDPRSSWQPAKALCCDSSWVLHESIFTETFGNVHYSRPYVRSGLHSHGHSNYYFPPPLVSLNRKIVYTTSNRDTNHPVFM
jgi:hypothetical protein